ncbi:MAG: YbaB/EbfC family nucleoid-associated protein [Clostridia bacterium]|nr:YbaB/EbfC family nucleoid-associated protein [Clostridia bacterium]
MAKGGFRGGMPGGGNMQNMIKQAQQMQQRVMEAQQQLEETEVTASSGGGVVTITMTGDMRVKDIELDPKVVDPDDVEMLQDLMVAAFNECASKVDQMKEQVVGQVTGGMNLGGLF